MAFNKKDTFILGNTMKKLDFSNRVQNVKCPTLVICGENDSANIKSAHYLAENIKNAKLEIMKNTGHNIIICHNIACAKNKGKEKSDDYSRAYNKEIC